MVCFPQSSSTRVRTKAIHLLRHLTKQSNLSSAFSQNIHGSEYLVDTLKQGLSGDNRNETEASMMLMIDMLNGDGYAAGIIRESGMIIELQKLKDRMEQEKDADNIVIDDVQLCQRLINTINGPLPAA